ncbi:MAG TPA: cyclase family protein [Bacillales bacterium]|nr:cyclase family protein [Bacillales bacterium]
MNKRFIDLSHTIEHGVVTYKGLPAPLICDYLSREASREHYAEGTEFQIGKIEMVANTGTYIDTPFHRYADGKDLSEVEIKASAGLEGIVIKMAEGVRAVDETHFAGLDLAGKAVLVHTGWDRHWNTDRYFENHPYLTASAAAFLLEQKAALVGIDAVNIDDTSGHSRPVHSALLKAEVPIVEHLCNLQEIPEGQFRFYAVPPKIKGMGTFPVRAFAEIDR